MLTPMKSYNYINNLIILVFGGAEEEFLLLVWPTNSDRYSGRR